jgi:hypothetical protein
MNILKDLQYDDLTEDLQLIYDVCGEAMVIKLIENLGGLSFYVPKITRFDDLIYRHIKENKSLTLKKLAMTLGVTEQYLKSIVKKYN